MKIFRIGLVLVVLLLTFVPTSGQSDTPTDQTSSASWQIAFLSGQQNGGYDLYLMNADGTDIRRLTQSRRASAYDPPVWSPDGTHFAYEYGGVIAVVDADGTNGHRLTDIEGPETEPAWSPDGTHIAFVSGQNEESEIYTIAIDGTDLRRLTENEYPDYSPAWSPDGERIAFSSYRYDRSNIYVVYLNNIAYPTRITNDITNPYDFGFRQEDPVWSPNGNSIAFMAVCCKTSNIYVVDADGTNMHRVYDNTFGMSWSPDSTQIAFHRIDHNPTYDINLYIKNADGTRLVQLTGHDSDDADFDPVWSPDGMQIAFSSEREGNTDIYLMNKDGSNVRRLTTDATDEITPVWVQIATSD